MATISKRKRGGWEIQFVIDGKRKSFYPGVIPKREATQVKVHLEAIVSAHKAGLSMPDATALWLADRFEYQEKLHKLDLIEAPAKEQDCPTIAACVESYIQSRSDVKESTATVWRRCQKHITSFFTSNPRIDAVTLSDVKDFRQYLLRDGNIKSDGGLSENSTRKMCSIARQIFEDALERELIQKNPFSHKSIPTNVRANRSRDFFISAEQAERIYEACPDVQWKLIFALSRWGGLRCPSETLAMTWDHVRWDRGIIIIPSPKTEHHGKDFREFPIVPKLNEVLLDASELAGADEYLITKYRSAESNLRSQMHKITRRAGYTPWAKTFNNLRASCETELLENHPYHVVCAWMGHTKAVSMTNYAQVRDSDFEKARATCTVKSTVESDGSTVN